MNKKAIAVAVSGALVAPMAAHAVKYKLSGQVNRAIQWRDDGQATGTQFVDNGASGTRWRMTGSEDIGNGMKVGFNWEWQNSSNGSGSGSVKGAAGGDGQAMRKAEVWFSGRWGKLSVGQGDGAGNGTTEMDLTSTWNAAATVTRSSFTGGLAWRTSGGGSLAQTQGDTGEYFDAFSRYDRVRYDTPALGPVTISGSVGDDSKWEIAARASSGIAGGQLSAGLWYGASTALKSGVGGSAAYLFSQGTSIMFSASSVERKVPAGVSVDDPLSYYVKVGHNWGNNSVSVGYGETKDAVPGFKDSGFNVGFNHNIPKAKVDVYASAGMNSLDAPAGVSAEDMTFFVVGSRLAFD
jgi:predicted porin